MPTLYLIEQNTILRKTSDRLRLCKKRARSKTSTHVTEGEILLELPCSDIDQVMLFGNVQVTTQALQELLQHGIELALFSYSGKLLGQLTPPKTKNINLRIAQFEKFQQKDFGLEFARKIVQSKIRSAVSMLQNHLANHPGLFTTEEIGSLNNYLQQAEQADNLDSLRGFEGSSTAAYFKLMGRMLKSPWKFDGRNRRPPKDPVNAVLSFGYVVVGSEIQSLLDGVGFDPFLGFYHQIRYGRPGLALDLLEEYRHCLVDRLALSLFNKGILKQDDFYSPKEGGVYLNTTGKQKFFKHYETMLGKMPGSTSTAQTKPGFRAIFQKQIAALAHAIQENKNYIPVNK